MTMSPMQGPVRESFLISTCETRMSPLFRTYPQPQLVRRLVPEMYVARSFGMGSEAPERLFQENSALGKRIFKLKPSLYSTGSISGNRFKRRIATMTLETVSTRQKKLLSRHGDSSIFGADRSSFAQWRAS